MRRALAEAQRKLHALSSDTGAMIDRRIVVKMLITYFEKDFSGGWRCGGVLPGVRVWLQLVAYAHVTTHCPRAMPSMPACLVPNPVQARCWT